MMDNFHRANITTEDTDSKKFHLQGPNERHHHIKIKHVKKTEEY